MASGDGISYNKIVETETHKHVPDTYQTIYREVYWARYVDWSVTTPLLLADLALLAGLNGASMLVAIVADIIMILTGLFAAFGNSDGTKWGWYTIACLAYLVIVYQLALNGRAAAANKDGKTKAFFAAIAGFTLILWTVYPMYIFYPPLRVRLANSIIASGVSLTVDAWLVLTLRSSHMLFLMFLPSRSLASGFSSPMTACPAREFDLLQAFDLDTDTFQSSPSVEGFWSNGFGGGSIRVGDD